MIFRDFLENYQQQMFVTLSVCQSDYIRETKIGEDNHKSFGEHVSEALCHLANQKHLDTDM